MAKQKTKTVSDGARSLTADGAHGTAPESAFERPLARWHAPNFLRYERGPVWFTIMGTVDGLLLLYAFLTSSLSMALVFLLVPVVLILEHRRKPELVEVIISEYGIKFGNLKFPYSNIKKFWILHTPPNLDELHLLTSDRLHSEVTIPLMGTDPVALRQYLVTQILEWEGKGPSTLDTLIRLLRLS